MTFTVSRNWHFYFVTIHLKHFPLHHSLLSPQPPRLPSCQKPTLQNFPSLLSKMMFCNLSQLLPALFFGETRKQPVSILSQKKKKHSHSRSTTNRVAKFFDIFLFVFFPKPFRLFCLGLVRVLSISPGYESRNTAYCPNRGEFPG